MWDNLLQRIELVLGIEARAQLIPHESRGSHRQDGAEVCGDIALPFIVPAEAHECAIGLHCACVITSRCDSSDGAEVCRDVVLPPIYRA